MARKVVSGKNLPIHSPLVPSLVAWLVMDKLDAAGWVWGAVGFMFLLIWIVFVYDFFDRDEQEVL